MNCAGEDFLDLTAGIRAVDEAIRFPELPEKSRIGHGMAIALDTKAYYPLNHRNLVLREAAAAIEDSQQDENFFNC